MSCRVFRPRSPSAVFLSVDVFAKIEDDIAGFRAFVKRDLTMDPAVSTQNRVATAKLINAWETAQVRGK